MGLGSESGGEWRPRGVNQEGEWVGRPIRVTGDMQVGGDIRVAGDTRVGGDVRVGVGICEWGGWIFGTARAVLWYILVLCTKVYQFGTVCYVWYNVPKRTKAYQKCTNVPNLVFGTAGEGGVWYGLVHFCDVLVGLVPNAVLVLGP